MQTFQVQNDNTIRWRPLTRATDKAFVSDATVTAALLDPNGATVSGLSSVAMTLQSGSNGAYIGTAAAALFPTSLTLGEGYTLVITITNPDGNTGHIELPAQVVTRVS